MSPTKPTREEIQAAEGKTVPDVIAPDLKVLFCGINPGLYSGAVGHHFASPSNRFWPAIHAAGFTDRQFEPAEEQELLHYSCGITNFVARATARASDLSRTELIEGGERLAKKVQRYQPAYIAVLGLGAYRKAFGERQAGVGPKTRTIGGARVWLLPNPSGLNAHYQIDDLARAYGALRDAAFGDAAESPNR
jgi:TDG/mug DNA glycosylase family protein